MAKDSQLLSLVKSFTLDLSQGNMVSAGERIRPILYRWAGVDSVSPTSCGSSVDAQKLGFLEKFLGRTYSQSGSANPPGGAGTILAQTYASLVPALVARLVAQVAEVPVEYDPLSDQLVFDGTLT